MYCAWGSDGTSSLFSPFPFLARGLRDNSFSIAARMERAMGGHCASGGGAGE